MNSNVQFIIDLQQCTVYDECTAVDSVHMINVQQYTVYDKYTAMYSL